MIKNTINKVTTTLKSFYGVFKGWISLLLDKISAVCKNPKFIKFVIWAFVFLGLIQLAFGILIYGFKSEDKVTRSMASVIPFPAALVNQDFISYNNYLAEKDYIHHFYNSTKQEGIDFTEIDKEIMNQLVENRIIASQARYNKIKVSDQEIDSTINEIVDQNGGEEKVGEVLNELYGLDLNQFRTLVRTQLLREKLANELISKVKVKHILIRVDKDATEDKVAESRAKIDNVLNEIKGGLDFSEVAKKYSEDTGSAEQGGDLEPFTKGEMVEEFSDKAFSTEVGSISDPVRTDFGWHIIKVEEHTGKIEKSFTDWIEELKDKSFILSFYR